MVRFASLPRRRQVVRGEDGHADVPVHGKQGIFSIMKQRSRYCISPRFIRVVGGLVVICALMGAGRPAAAQLQFGGSSGPLKARPTLYPSVKQVVPGQPFDVAIEFVIEKGWHIYWSNPGDSGLPPSIQWTLPEGFTVSEPRFPVPRRYVVSGITTFVLEDRPILLVTVTPPASALPKTMELKADLNWLVCQDACIPEDSRLTLTLSAAPPGTTPEAANADIFQRARAAMPARKSDYVSLTVSAPQFRNDKGHKFDLLIEADIARGHHIQSNKPAQDYLIAADVIMDATRGLKIGPAVFPPAKERLVPALGKLSEFEGKVTIRVPCEVRDEPPRLPARVAGLFTFQACTDQGQCYPPETIEFALELGGPRAGSSTTGADLGSAAPLATHDGSVVASTTSAPETPADRGGAQDSSRKPDAPAPVKTRPAEGMVKLLIFGFFGGLILNVMPCVLPVISIKVLSFVQQAGEDRGRLFRLGLTYSAGILVWFWIFALIASTGQVPLQDSRVVVGLTAIMFVFGLSLLGVFELNLPGFASSAAGAVSEREGYVGAFFKGFLATLLGTACTAPLLAPALGAASIIGGLGAWVIFTSAGLGMASPYLLLCIMPQWRRYIPKPGPWMTTFKQLMGFLLMGTAVWLLTIVAALMDAGGVVWTVCFLTFLGMSCWLLGRIEHDATPARRVRRWIEAIGVAVLGGYFSFGLMYEPPSSTVTPVLTADPDDTEWDRLSWEENGELRIPWRPFRKGLAESLASKGYTVYVDYTATWCATCQTNKKLFVEVDKVIRVMRDNRVIPIKADWTRRDPVIAEDLQRFGRNGVPLNVVYPAGRPDDVIVLPTAFVSSAPILDALQQAGPSKPARADAGR